MLFIIDKEDSQTSDLCSELDGEFYLLGDEIEYFNSIIDYDDMWDLHEAHRRLDNGWKLVSMTVMVMYFFSFLFYFFKYKNKKNFGIETKVLLKSINFFSGMIGIIWFQMTFK